MELERLPIVLYLILVDIVSGLLCFLIHNYISRKPPGIKGAKIFLQLNLHSNGASIEFAPTNACAIR